MSNVLCEPGLFTVQVLNGSAQGLTDLLASTYYCKSQTPAKHLILKTEIRKIDVLLHLAGVDVNYKWIEIEPNLPLQRIRKIFSF